jgi:3alpha-hydroxysteroid 3-dehydrogenase
MSIIAVIGSASGIGAAACAVLQQAGHEIVGVDLQSADVIADLSSPEGRREAVAGVLGRCSGVLDGLAACAGLGPHVDDASRHGHQDTPGTLMPACGSRCPRTASLR